MYPYFSSISFEVSFKFHIFAAIQFAPKGIRISFLLEKDVYERYLLRTNLANSRPEDAQPNVRVMIVIPHSYLIFWYGGLV